MPDAVRLDYGARLVDQNVEREPRLLDIGPHGFGRLRDYRGDLHAAFGISRGVACQFTEPAAAVRSPGAAMEREQHRSFLEELR